MLKSYYLNIISREQECIAATFRAREGAVAAAHQTVADLQQLLASADKQPEGFVYRSLMHDAGLAIHHAVAGLYRQSYAAQRVMLESGIAALFYSAQPLDMKRWAEGHLDVSWQRVSRSDDGVLSPRYVSAFLAEAESSREDYHNRADALFGELSDFVHKNVKTFSFDETTFAFDGPRFDGTMKAFSEVTRVLAYGFCVRYLGTMQAQELEKVSAAVDTLVGEVAAFQRLIGGQAG